jgi:hypothetical protein
MDYWCIYCLGDLCAVVGGSALVRVCCETDLVVKNDVDDASGTVVNKILEAQGLPDDALSGHCGVSVDEHSENPEWGNSYFSLLVASCRARVLP